MVVGLLFSIKNIRNFMFKHSENIHHAVPENIHTHPEEGHWKFRGGGDKKPNFLKESMKQNRNFQRGGG